MEHKRIKWLDFAKGIAILFVVIAHCSGNTQFQNNIIIQIIKYLSFLFVMPVFFSISGFLYNKIYTFSEFLELTYKKIIGLLLPYLFVSFIYFIYHSVKHNLDFLNLILGFKLDIVLWFLPSLFIMFIIVGLFNLFKINVYVLYILSIIILLISTNFWMYAKDFHIHYSNAYLIYSYFFFFCLGIFIRQNKKYFNIIFYNNKLRLSISIVFFMSIILEMKINSLKYLNNYITISNIIPKIISVIVFYSFCISVNSYKTWFRYFDKYGKYSLIIYLTHYSFEEIATKLFSSGIVSLVCLVLLTWLFSTFICYLSSKFKIIRYIFYPRKYTDKLINEKFHIY